MLRLEHFFSPLAPYMVNVSSQAPSGSDGWWLHISNKLNQIDLFHYAAKERRVLPQGPSHTHRGSPVFTASKKKSAAIYQNKNGADGESIEPFLLKEITGIVLPEEWIAYAETNANHSFDGNLDNKSQTASQSGFCCFVGGWVTRAQEWDVRSRSA